MAQVILFEIHLIWVHADKGTLDYGQLDSNMLKTLLCRSAAARWVTQVTEAAAPLVAAAWLRRVRAGVTEPLCLIIAVGTGAGLGGAGHTKKIKWKQQASWRCSAFLDLVGLPST